MMLQIVNRIMSLPIVSHLGLAALAVAAFAAAKSTLDQSYAASRHPVDYATGQLAFSAQKVTEFYQAMTASGTLPLYWRTQIIDFGFIISVVLIGLFLGSLAPRLWPSGHWGRRFGLAVPVLAVLGALFDAIENLLSFWMLSVFPSIPTSMAVAYSGAAATKFLFLTCAMFGFAIIAGFGAARIIWMKSRSWLKMVD
jgi:hypothetical protein